MNSFNNSEVGHQTPHLRSIGWIWQSISLKNSFGDCSPNVQRSFKIPSTSFLTLVSISSREYEKVSQVFVLVYSFQFHSIIKPFLSCSNMPAIPENNHIWFFFCRFTTRPSLLVVSLRMLSCCWKPITVYERRTTSHHQKKAQLVFEKALATTRYTMFTILYNSIGKFIDEERKQNRAAYFAPRGHIQASVRSPPTRTHVRQHRTYFL